MAKTGVSLFLSKPLNLLAGIIIFFSATQLGLHFWPLSSLVYGIRIDYLSPTIYFLDILIVLFLALRRLLNRRPEQSSSRDAEGGRSLLIVIPILLTNLLFSQNPLATLSWSLHLILYLLFIISVSIYNLRSTIYKILPLTMFFQLALATVQVFLGHSAGGFMYYLGERMVAVGSPAVALATFMGHVVLRAYGTFGHPNVLAGWLVISLLILLQFKLNRKLLLLTSGFTIIGVILTQSRSAALALFGLIIPFYILKNLKSRLLYFGILVFCFFVSFPLLTRASDLALLDRLSLQGVSSQVIRTLPIFGSGAQASISTYPSIAPNFRLLQPDHDSFTLFLSWFGLFGLLSILYLLRFFVGSYSLKVIFPLLPLLLLDHYLATSPQGLFILLLYFAVALNYSHAQKNI